MSAQPPAPPGRKRRLGEILMDAGLINDLQLRAALSEQRKWGGKLGRTLVEMGFVDEESMSAALSRQLNLPRVDLDNTQVGPEVLQLLRVDVAERYGVFPIGGDARQKTLQLATSDPTNVEALQELAFHTGVRILPSVAGSSAIDRAIRRHYYGESTTSSLAASPEEVGMSEVQLSAQDIIERSGSRQPAAPGGADSMAATAPASAAQVELARKLEELTSRMDAIEKHAANQVRALRGLVEMLIDKGVIGRDEYLNKVRSKE